MAVNELDLKRNRSRSYEFAIINTSKNISRSMSLTPLNQSYSYETPASILVPSFSKTPNSPIEIEHFNLGIFFSIFFLQFSSIFVSTFFISLLYVKMKLKQYLSHGMKVFQLLNLLLHPSQG